MSQPFLWGSHIALPTGISDADVTALSNGTFLVIGKTEAATQNARLKGWIYNADGSLKAEQIIETQPYGGAFSDLSLTRIANNPFAVELPDGRIALTWSIASSAPGHVGAWLGIYGSDLKPLGKPLSVAGMPTDPTSPAGQFKADDAIGLPDGRVIATYRSLGGTAFLRVLNSDGTLSNPLELGPTLPSNMGDGFGSVADLTALTNGKVVAAFRAGGGENKIYVLDPSAPGVPVVLKEISIPVVSEPGVIPIEVTALEGGRFVVTWTEAGRVGTSGSEPVMTVRYQIFNSEGAKLTEPLAFYATLGEAESVGTPGVVALPGGGFALAAQVFTSAATNASEVRLAVFDATGTRVSEKLLASSPAAGNTVSLEGLSLLADGRIAALMSNGIQIIDTRDKAIVLKGTARSDQYIGTAFDDTLDGGAGADILNGGNGIDFVSFASAGSGVVANLSGGSAGDAAGDVYASIEGLLGSSFGDVFTGNGAAILKGRGGNDTYFVKAGDSVEEKAQEGHDSVVASGTYALHVDADIEVLKLSGLSSKASAHLTGSATDNTLIGHAGNNRLKGEGGNDILHGGLGKDILTGGRGKDKFVFNTKPGKTNLDQVTDYKVADDTIWLDNKVFTKLGKKGTEAKPVKLSSKFFTLGDKAKDANDYILYDKKTGYLSYDKDGSGSAAAIKIAKLQKNLKMSHHEFFVV